MTKEQIIELIGSSKKFTYWEVFEGNPFSSYYDEHNYYFDEYEAENYYNECLERQGGRASYDDDFGGGDYSLNSYETDIYGLFDIFEPWIVLYYLQDNGYIDKNENYEEL